MPPKEPLMYRLYEIVQNYGYAYKAILNEKFGDGIMSAISFSTKVEKETDKDGNKWAVITLRGKWYVGLLIIIIMILLSCGDGCHSGVRYALLVLVAVGQCGVAKQQSFSILPRPGRESWMHSCQINANHRYYSYTNADITSTTWQVTVLEILKYIVHNPLHSAFGCSWGNMSILFV